MTSGVSRAFPWLLAAAIAAGLFIAWIGSRPDWDDAGVIAGLIIVSSAIFACAFPTRPWIWALAIGAWIPLIGLARSGGPATLLALAAGFAGAYAGAGVRRLLDGTA